MTPVSAIVVAYRSQNTLKRCVENALQSGVHSVIVWANSPDDLAFALRAFRDEDRVTVAGAGKNLGFGTAVNRAVALGPSGTSLLLLNPDCFLSGQTLDSLRGLLDGAADVGAVAPMMRYSDGQFGIAGGPAPSVAKELLALTRIDDLLPGGLRARLIGLFDRLGGHQAGFGKTLERGDPVDVDWASGFCLLVRAIAFRAVEGFDEQYFLYFEDVDFCLRLREAGFRVLVDRRVDALHLESQSSTRRTKGRHYLNGLATYLANHGGGASRRMLSPLLRSTAR